MRRAAWLAAALALQAACATEQQTDVPEASSGTTSGHGGPGGAGGSVGKLPNMDESAGKPADGGVTAQAGTSALAGQSNGGSAAGHSLGGTSGGGTSGASSAGGRGGANGNAGQAGSTNQPAPCDEATATLLATMSSNFSVASNVCLKMTLPADQTWIKKITLQPDGAVYPLPFTWSNCTSTGSGTFTANYGNVVVSPVSPQCPILVKLGGNAASFSVQWWGG